MMKVETSRQVCMPASGATDVEGCEEGEKQCMIQYILVVVKWRESDLGGLEPRVSGRQTCLVGVGVR